MKIFDKILMISMQTIMTIKSFVLISEKLVVHYRCLDDSLIMLWRDIVETLKISQEVFVNFIVFVVLTSEAMIFDCWFNDDSLTIF